MRKINIPSTKSALKSAVSTLAAAATASANAGRSNVAKPASAPLPAPTGNGKPGKPVAAPKPVMPPADKAPSGLTRDAQGVVRQATNYDTYSDRDNAYLRFFGSVARKHGHACTLRQIYDAGVARPDAPSNKRFNPHYLGSAKATDVGAINRQIKSGHFTRSSDGTSIVATKLAQSTKLYNGKA